MITRRTLLGTSAVAGGAALAGTTWGAGAAAPSALPAPGKSGIEHIVVVMMENRSYDHFMGWLPGGNGKQAGLRFQDRYGAWHPTYRLHADGATCNNTDPDHSYEGGRQELNFGRCDGWLKTGQNDLLSIGYFKGADLGFLGTAAPEFTTCDRYFAATMAETYPNRFYQHSAQTDRLHNNTTISTLPTIWDRCKAAGVSANYYYSDIPFLALWGQKYLTDGTAQPASSFFADAAGGTLPKVSFLDPMFNGESNGASGDDHPSADIRKGEQFLSEVYTAIFTGAGKDNTLLVINYDEWGGFFDHVVPNRMPDNHPWCGLRGFRVPALVIGARARRHFIAPWAYDHTSVLKMIEWRFGLKPLTKRDAAVRNLAEVLDFTHPPRTTFPAISYTAPPSTPCGAGTTVGTSAETEWTQLATLAAKEGFPLT